jgi:predicted RNA-binding protein with TRAM domain
MERHGFSDGVAPVNVGDEIDVRIEAVGEKGDGIAKKKGFVLFIPNTKEGDEVRVRITKVLKKVGFAEVVGESQSAPEVEKPKREKKVEDLIPEGDDSEDFGEEPVDEEKTEEDLEVPEPEEETTEELPQEDDLEEPPTPKEEDKSEEVDVPEEETEDIPPMPEEELGKETEEEKDENLDEPPAP